MRSTRSHARGMRRRTRARGGCGDAADLRPPQLAALCAVLAPGRDGAGFYLADAFAPGLRAARAAVADAEAAFDTRRAAVAALVRDAAGVDPVGDEFVVLRDVYDGPLPDGVRVVRETRDVSNGRDRRGRAGARCGARAAGGRRRRRAARARGARRARSRRGRRCRTGARRARPHAGARHVRAALGRVRSRVRLGPHRVRRRDVRAARRSACRARPHATRRCRSSCAASPC